MGVEGGKVANCTLGLKSADLSERRACGTTTSNHYQPISHHQASKPTTLSVSRAISHQAYQPLSSLLACRAQASMLACSPQASSTSLL